MRILAFTGVCLTFVLLFSGCSPVVNAPGPVAVEKGNSNQKIAKSIERLLIEGSLVKAHAALHEALRGDATETALAEVYTQVENRLLVEAEKAEGQGLFDEAGKLYRMALDTYPKNPRLQTALVMKEEAIRLKIDACADELMKSGLVAYREGELADAVAKWERIALFYPGYSPSEVAIKTAKQQMENLERLSPDNTN